MEKKKFLKYLKGALMLIMFSQIFCACSKNEDDEDEVNTNPKNIYGIWQQYEVVAEDNTWVKGDPGIYWVFKSDGSFQNEYQGEIITVGTFQITGSVLTINSHFVDNPNIMENYSGNFYFSHGYMDYDYYNLKTGEKSIVLFKKM